MNAVLARIRHDPLLWLLVCVPALFAAERLSPASHTLLFVLSVLAIVPLATLLSHATESVAARTGDALGGLLNVTFGNVSELILALFVLSSGNVAVAKAQITGSIIGNSLLGLGLAIVVGSWGRARQTFKREHAGNLSSLLILSVIALLVPALFDYTERGMPEARRLLLDEHLSLGVAGVLVLVYLAFGTGLALATAGLQTTDRLRRRGRSGALERRGLDRAG